MGSFWDSFQEAFLPTFNRTFQSGLADIQDEKRWLKRQQTIMDLQEQEEQKAIDAYATARDAAKAKYGLVEDPNEIEQRQFGDTIISLPKLKTAEEKQRDDKRRKVEDAILNYQEKAYDFMGSNIMNPGGEDKGGLSINPATGKVEYEDPEVARQRKLRNDTLEFTLGEKKKEVANTAEQNKARAIMGIQDAENKEEAGLILNRLGVDSSDPMIQRAMFRRFGWRGNSVEDEMTVGSDKFDWAGFAQGARGALPQSLFGNSISTVKNLF